MLASVLGVSFDENLALELSECPDTLAKIQGILDEFKVEQHSREDFSFFLDNVLQDIICGIQPSATASSVANDTEKSIGTLLNQPELDNLSQSRSSLILQYLLSAERRCETFLADHNRSEDDKIILSICKTRMQVCLILALRGLTMSGVTAEEFITCITYRSLTKQFDVSQLLQTVCAFIQQDIVDGDALSNVFNPMFSKLREWIIMISRNDRMNPAIQGLCAMIHTLIVCQCDGKRPLAEMLVARDDFLPVTSGENRGRLIIGLSYLGPILSMSTVSDDDVESVYQNRFDADLTLFRTVKQRDSIFTKYHSLTNSLRVSMHAIVHALLVNTSSRSKTLDYLAEVLDCNRKRNQIHVNHRVLACDSVMLNLLSVMLQLSEKIPLNKVNDCYVFHPHSRLKMRDEPAISFPPEEIDAVKKEFDVAYEMKFTTECFYMTIFALNVGMNASVYQANAIRGQLTEIRRALREAQELIKRKGGIYAYNPVMLRRINIFKQMEKRVTVNYMNRKCLIHNDELILQCVKFLNKQLELVLRSIPVDFVHNTIPSTPPKIFGALPELFIESALNFMEFALREASDVFITNCTNVSEHLLVLCCCLNFFKNPYLASKVVDVIFRITPIYNPPAEPLFRRIVDNNFAGQRLFTSLSKFYADVESTEFYDKFNIRRSIQVIFKCMWTYLIHRRSMVEDAERQSPDFIRFINMVINDTTFLLDESLTGLKKIRDIETLMENEAEFNALSEEDRNQKISALNEVKRSVRSWMILCNDTLEFFIILTTDNPSIFYDTLGERVAAMLNYNIVQLCGPKCSELKVKDAKARFEWDPRRLLEQIVNIYLNLSSETFAQNIAQDERSYNPEMFAAILEKMKNRHILEMSQTERFKNLIEMADHFYRQKAQEEMDYGDDIPDEFVDELVYTLMTEPMRLPSGQVVDKKNIMRHLLSSKTNPFTRQPLTLEELIPDVQLKERIECWMAKKKAAAKR